MERKRRQREETLAKKNHWSSLNHFPLWLSNWILFPLIHPIIICCLFPSHYMYVVNL
jgi:hypothetical protein